MYVYKNKESGLYLVLSVSEMEYGIPDWNITETDEVSLASKFEEVEDIEREKDFIKDLNLDDWEEEYVEL